MKQRFSIILAILCLSLLVTFTHLRAIQNQTASSALTTQQLTDVIATTYDVVDPVIVGGQNSAHVIWSEYTVFNPLQPIYDSDMFYAHLSLGQVTHLRATTGEVLSSGKIALDSHDNAYVIWEEDTGTPEEGDLFFWKTGMAAPQNLSDHEQTKGDVGDFFIVLDETDMPHVLWAEATSVWSYDPAIFYWNPGNDTVKLADTVISNSNFNVTNAVGLATQNGVVHALWHNHTPFYWNSDTQIAINLRGEGGGWYQEIEDYFLSQAGTLFALWREDLGPSSAEPTAYRIWDSGSGQDHVLVTTVDYVEMKLVKDSIGSAHILWSQQSGSSSKIYHWDNVNQISSELGQGFDLLVAEGQVGNHVHVTWIGKDVNWPEHSNDLLYWRSDMSVPVNITDHSQPASSPVDIRLLVDGMDVAHVIWSESKPTYYNSLSNTTSVLTGTLNLADTNLHSNYTIQLEDPLHMRHEGNLLTARDGTGYVLLGKTTESIIPFSVWESTTGTYGSIEAVYGPTDPDVAMIWFDSDGEVHVAWEDNSLTSEGTNLHYWNATTSSQDLTDNDYTDGYVDMNSNEVLGVSDASGGVYLAWPELFDGDSDMYAAFAPIHFTDFVYLPLVVK